MIQFLKILNEIQRGEWFEPKNLDEYKKQILKLIQTAYAPIGGNLKFNTVSDITKAGGQFFKVVDLDSDDDIDAVLVYKNRDAGNKGVAMGHDGSRLSKSHSTKKILNDLNRKYYFLEASGPMEKLLLKANVPYVDNENIVKKILKKEIEWVGDGKYYRDISGNKVQKRLFGTPKINN
jgi:hypothetical protein